MVNSIKVSEPELSLLAAIAEVNYGELMFIEMMDAPREIPAIVNDRTKKLLDFIRDGNPSLHSIKVHQKSPVQVVVAGQTGNILYHKKIQL